MLLPTKGKIICEVILRERQLPSGLWMADKQRLEKKDNVARVLGVGDPAIKDCYLCHERRWTRPPCKYINKKTGKLKDSSKKCKAYGKLDTIIAKRTDIIHFRNGHGIKLKHGEKQYVMLINDDVIALEGELNNGQSTWIKAVGSIVIVKLHYVEKIGSIIVPENAKQMSGDCHGEVISVGPDYPDKGLKQGDKLIFLRNEGYRFRGYYDRQDYHAVKERWIYGRKS